MCAPCLAGKTVGPTVGATRKRERSQPYCAIQAGRVYAIHTRVESQVLINERHFSLRGERVVCTRLETQGCDDRLVVSPP